MSTKELKVAVLIAAAQNAITCAGFVSELTSALVASGQTTTSEEQEHIKNELNSHIETSQAFLRAAAVIAAVDLDATAKKT